MNSTSAITTKGTANSRQTPHYIAVEGPIGVGKTSLAQRLATTFGYSTLLEQPEANPFLPRFHADRRSNALSTQLFFLLQRAEQIRSLRQADMFEPARVADFLIEKDLLFAETCLDQDELTLYRDLYERLCIDAPAPDLVIYLQAPPQVLLERIRRRGHATERIDAIYLDALCKAYTRFFHFYNAAPLLIVNVSVLDLVRDDNEYQRLVDLVCSSSGGRRYFNPHPGLI